MKTDLFSNRLPMDIISKIYGYDNTYHDYFRIKVLPELKDKAWARIFCRIDGLVHRYGFLPYTNEMLSLWTMVDDFSDEEEKEEEFDWPQVMNGLWGRMCHHHHHHHHAH